MVGQLRVWYMDDEVTDQRLEHHRNPPQFIDLDTLKKLTGVLYWKIDVDKCKEEGLLDKVRKERGYSYEDVIEISEEKLPNYEEKLKIFFTEHLHTDEEIRLVLDGSGYFDVRAECEGSKEAWIRIEVLKGDLIVLPAGIYHRFTLDSNNYIKAMRLFIGEPVWTPHNRPADDLDCRKDYLTKKEKGFEELIV